MKKCRQWSVSMMKLSPTVPRNAAKNRQIASLPRHADEDVAKAGDERQEHQRRIAHAGEPAAGHEGVQIGIMGVFRKEAVKLQRADAEGQIERHLGAKNMAAEPAEAALVIALVETGALLKHVGHRTERQQRRDQ